MAEAKPKSVKILDTLLRDGTQAEGISFSVEDKLKIAQRLDEFGVHYIEGGYPGSNPKDVLFFKKARELRLRHAKIVAFGSTRRKGISAFQDSNLQAIVKVKPHAACIFGKSWDFHVLHALRAAPEENLRMIEDSVRFLKGHRLEVIYDAEHFFDGYRSNPSYALETLEAAVKGGADNLTLCDTNGGRLPHEISEIVRAVRLRFRTPLGIHAHNDSECGVANTLSAVQAGCVLVQGTMNGYGERCGNANLISIIANLKLKLGIDCVADEKLKMLTEVSLYISEVANQVPNDRAPFVGHSAFAHKGGGHVSGVARHVKTYEHIPPFRVGNTRRILISELSGRSNVLMKSRAMRLRLTKDPQALRRVLERVKQLETEGYQFEGAEGSFEILVRKALGRHKPFFELRGFRVTVDKEKPSGHPVSVATVKLSVDGKEEHTAAEGEGPVSALDNALRRALEKFYPELKEVSLSDFKVRVIDASSGTRSRVRVLIESRDGKEAWGTVGVSENILEAAYQALVDSIEYKLLKARR